MAKPAMPGWWPGGFEGCKSFWQRERTRPAHSRTAAAEWKEEQDICAEISGNLLRAAGYLSDQVEEICQEVCQGVFGRRSFFPKLGCAPCCGQSPPPSRLTSPLAVPAEDLLLICELDDIKDFSRSQWQVLGSAPPLCCCRIDHHLSQDIDAAFKLKHKQQCPWGVKSDRSDRSPSLENSRFLSGQMVCGTGLIWGNGGGVTWRNKAGCDLDITGPCGAELLSAIALHPSQEGDHSLLLTLNFF